MAIQVVSGTANTILTIDSTSNAARVTQYDINGNPTSDQVSLGNTLNALNSAVTMTLGGQSTFAVDVEGTSGTITLSFEYNIDNSTWHTLSMTPVAGGSTVTSTTGNGQWVASIAGFYAVRARVSAISGGASMIVSANAGPGQAKQIAQAITTAGTLDTNIASWLGSTAPTVGQKTAANSVPVAVASDNGLALDATLTGGTQKAIVRGGAKGATVAADITSTAEGTDHQAIDVQLYHSGAAKDPTQIRSLISSDIVTAAQGTAASLGGRWPVQITDGTNTMPTMDAIARAGFQSITDGTNGPAAVKAASTLAVAADKALVVSLNPASAGPKATSSTVTQVASSASSVTLLASNVNRLGALITNDSTAVLLVKLGTGATLTSYTAAVPISRGLFEVPFGYTGVITGIWVSANGNAYVTEVTP